MINDMAINIAFWTFLIEMIVAVIFVIVIPCQCKMIVARWDAIFENRKPGKEACVFYRTKRNTKFRLIGSQFWIVK